jgi:hypothetical protein
MESESWSQTLAVENYPDAAESEFYVPNIYFSPPVYT